VSLDTELPVDALQELVRDFKAEIRYRTGKTFPDDPVEQLWGAIGAVFGSWMIERAKVYRQLNGIPESSGTAVAASASPSPRSPACRRGPSSRLRAA